MPNHHAGQLILQSRARRPGEWLNLRAATPAELAWEAIAADASAKGLGAADEISLEGIVIEEYLATRHAFFPEREDEEDDEERGYFEGRNLVARHYSSVLSANLSGMNPEGN